jgi:ketosteroid isomerase-like protein
MRRSIVVLSARFPFHSVLALGAVAIVRRSASMITRRGSLFAFAGLLAPLDVPASSCDDADNLKGAGRRVTGDIERDLIRIERDWAEAVVNPDWGAVRRIISDDFSVVDSTGHVWGQESYLDAIASGVAGIESLKIDDLEVRVYGGTAIVTGRLVYRAGLGRSDLNGAYRFTKVYVHRESGWLCVAAQEGRITE